jgi:release factor glutamine methyltransferase
LDHYLKAKECTVSSDAAQTAESSNDVWTVRRILEWTTAHLKKHGSETPRLDAEILLAHSRKCARIELYTRFNEPLSDTERATMRELVRRRAQAEPVAYLVGHREFFSLDFRVTPDVLIPRPETESLVVELLSIIEGGEQPRIADIGTGSGCIAIATAANNARVEVAAVDISKPALAVARENAQTHSVAERIHFFQGDLFAPLSAEGAFDAIASNPPYVAEDEMPTLAADIRLHEPHLALSAGPDGLAVIRRLVADAPNHLKAGGWLLLEISPEQADAIRGLLESDGRYQSVAVVKDLAGNARVMRAAKAGG